LPVGGLHSRHWGKLKDGEVVVYYTRDAFDKERRHHVETMTCRGRGRDEAEECAWEMKVPENSECFGIEHACQVEMVLEGPDGSELETCSRILLVQRLPLGSRPNTHV
jgi:hypothetical protein